MSSTSALSSISEVNYGPLMLRILTPMTVLVTLVVCLRIAMKIRRAAGIGIDDWLMIVSLVLSWGFYSWAVLLINFSGMGKPNPANSSVNLHRTIYDAEFVFAGQLIYATTIMTVKLSILKMYRQIFPVRLMKIGCLVLGCLAIIWWGAYVLIETFQCNPIKKLFNPDIKGQCISFYKFMLGIMIPNTITDVAILCLPVYEIMNLRLTACQRITLSAVFLLGSSVIAATGVRLRYLVLWFRSDDTDGTSYVKLIIWSGLELELAIICGCLPVLGPLFNNLIRIRPFAWVRKLTRCSRDYGTSETLNTPVTLRALRTIGGSTMHRGDTGKGRTSQDVRTPINSLRRFQKLDDDSDGVTKVSSYGNGKEPVREIPDLWPQGYATEYRAVVRKTSNVGGNKVPIGAIAVETVVDWEESGPASNTV
ncbi:hypothetical protein F4774DRAFT_213840 [Daldinia eschscholtzii]|nr:hypothetical protein F4774DRAFT_213840 [Daldinia eschscholtzii]